MGEIKIYRISGYMLISHDRLPRWQKFVKEIRALNEKHAIEKLYSILGSLHKLKRYHIKIVEIREISTEEVTDPNVLEIMKINWVVKR
ncbi:MAG: 50S ribosomal protein L18Ae [Desulfurococcaceae archaeon]